MCIFCYYHNFIADSMGVKMNDIYIDLDQLIIRLEFFKIRIKEIHWNSKQDVENYKIAFDEIINDLYDFKEKYF